MMLSGCCDGFAALGCIAPGCIVFGCMAPGCIVSADCIAALALSGGFIAASFPAVSIPVLLSERVRLFPLASGAAGGGAASHLGAPDFAAPSRACLGSG